MFRNLQDDLLDVVRNLGKMTFEEHVKYTCIEKLDACTNYISIPSVERKIERELEKEKREKLDNINKVLDADLTGCVKTRLQSKYRWQGEHQLTGAHPRSLCRPPYLLCPP